jgi:hypothetical protein
MAELALRDDAEGVDTASADVTVLAARCRYRELDGRAGAQEKARLRSSTGS